MALGRGGNCGCREVTSRHSQEVPCGMAGERWKYLFLLDFLGCLGILEDLDSLGSPDYLAFFDKLGFRFRPRRRWR